MVAVAPIMNDFSLEGLYRKHTAYHPGALKYFQDQSSKPRPTSE